MNSPKKILASSLLTLCTLLLVSCGQPNQVSDKKNVLFILVDDMGANDMSVNNTPTLTALANQGTVFSRYYTDSTCSPTRAALLTGLYPARLGFNPINSGISPEYTTLAEALKNAGYSTHHIGKWHLGTHPMAQPDQQGFDDWFGFLSQFFLKEGSNKKPHLPTYWNPYLEGTNIPPTQYQGYLTDIIANASIEKIKSLQNTEKPWFINLWFFAPHTPTQPKDKSIIGKEKAYLHVMNNLDQHIQRIINTLKETQQLDNTLIVFMSDNGGTNKNRDNNYPWKGKKAEYEEGGIRVPFFIVDPSKQLPKTTYSHPITSWDVMPTLLGLLDIKAPKSDGVNLVDAIKNNTDVPRHNFWELQWLIFNNFSVLSKDHTRRLMNEDKVLHYQGGEIHEKAGTDKELYQHYLSWHRDVHTPNFIYKSQGANGEGILTGNSFQRLPGFKGFTFGIAVKNIEAKAISQPIVQQPGIWGITQQEDQTLTVNLIGQQLSGPALPQQSCTAVIITTVYNYSDLRPDTEFTWAQLYYDSNLQSELKIPSMPKDHLNINTPTYIGMSKKHDTFLLGSLGKPIIYNQALPLDPVSSGTMSIKELSKTLCP